MVMAEQNIQDLFTRYNLYIHSQRQAERQNKGKAQHRSDLTVKNKTKHTKSACPAWLGRHPNMNTFHQTNEAEMTSTE